MSDADNKAEQNPLVEDDVAKIEDSTKNQAGKPEGEKRKRKKKKDNKKDEATGGSDGRVAGKMVEKKRKGSSPSEGVGEGASFSGDKSVDLKAKISRLKGKLEKYSTKCNEVNSRSDCSGLPEERSKDRRRKPRTTSERVVSQQEQPPQRQAIRSMSFSASSRSSGLTTNDPSDSSRKQQEDDDMVPRSSEKKRQRNRRRATKYSLIDRLYKKQSCVKGEFVLDNLSFFLLDLIITPVDRREHMIAAEARNREIILAEGNGWKLNPKITRWRSTPFRRPYDDISTLFVGAELAGKPFVACAAEPPPVVTFEDLVNSVVHAGLSDEQKKEFTLPVAAAGKRKTNYFMDGEFERRLEDFAQKCVDANLGVIVESDVRISAKNNDHAFIKVPDGDRDAMISSQLLRKFALQGDIIRAFVRNVEEDDPAEEAKCDPLVDAEAPPLDDSLDALPEEPIVVGKSCKAFVIRIAKEVNNRLVVGNFLSYRKNAKYITFVPRDMRMPNVRVYEESWPESFQQGKLENVPDTLYVAEIIAWQDEVCVGRIKQAIGKCGELDSENRAILLKNNLRFEPFDEKFHEMYSGDYEISEDEIAKREDLRKECIFTIDPLTAKDLDDAMSIKELFDGNFEIGVHISDVAYFLEEDSELDLQVKKRTTSVYMVNEVFHMLPKPLCLRCSLLPGTDKLAFSVFWIMSPKGEVLSTRFARTVIRSCTQLAYQHAQMIIDNPERSFVEADFPLIHNEFTAADIVRCVRQLNSLATILRLQRFENGALKIDRPKIYFDLDPETGAPNAYRQQEQLTANFLIEEFMLLANQSVANYIHEKFPDISILRNHQPPLKNVLKRIKDQLQKAGLVLDVSSSKSIYSSLGRLVSQSENPESASICLSQLVSKPMTRAKYFCSHDVDYENFRHYALSIPIYTHFTSPIRRYPDVLVHRVLAAAMSYAGVPKRTPTELKTLAECCNDDKYNAKLAGDDSTNLYFMHYVQRKGFLVMQAVVVDIFTYSFEAILVETGTIISINWKGNKDVHVAVAKENGACKAVIKYPSLGGKEIELKLCSEVWLKVTAKSKRLKGELVPPPSAKPILPTETTSEQASMAEEKEASAAEAMENKNDASVGENDDESGISAATTESSIEVSDEDAEEAVESACKQDVSAASERMSSEPPVVHKPLADVEVGVDLLSSICASQSLELARLLRIHENTDPDPRRDSDNETSTPRTFVDRVILEQVISADVKKLEAPQSAVETVSIAIKGSSNLEVDDDADIVIEAEEVIEPGGHYVDVASLDIQATLEKLSITSSENKEPVAESIETPDLEEKVLSKSSAEETEKHDGIHQNNDA